MVAKRTKGKNKKWWSRQKMTIAILTKLCKTITGSKGNSIVRGLT
jgi:hypothetical protein